MQAFPMTNLLPAEPRIVFQSSGPEAYEQHEVLKTPSDYIEARYPTLTKMFGPAFLEAHWLDSNQFLNIEPVEINVDLFAAILGGDESRCKLVYYLPDEQWYAYDPVLGYFTTTTEENLKLRLSQELIHCVAYLNQRPFVRIQSIFTKFRSEKVLETILKRASAMLGVREGFFAEGTGNRKDPILLTREQSAQIFASEALESKKGTVLSIAEAYVSYVDFCQMKRMPVVLHRNEFRGPTVDAVRSTYGMGLSKDLKIGGKWTAGWRNLDAKVLAA